MDLSTLFGRNTVTEKASRESDIHTPAKYTHQRTGTSVRINQLFVTITKHLTRTTYEKECSVFGWFFHLNFEG